MFGAVLEGREDNQAFIPSLDTCLCLLRSPEARPESSQVTRRYQQLRLQIELAHQVAMLSLLKLNIDP